MTDLTPELTIDEALFTTLHEELARRGGGRRESGAFLLGHAVADPEYSESVQRTVVALAFYDDLDPACLTGGITFGSDGYTALNAVCRRDGIRVLGDVHSHPGSWVQQSGIDAGHPMVARPGHVAIIEPNFAQGPVDPSALGAHVFGGSGRWTSYYGADVASVLLLTEAAAPPSTVPRWRRALRWLGHRIFRLRRLGRAR